MSRTCSTLAIGVALGVALGGCATNGEKPDCCGGGGSVEHCDKAGEMHSSAAMRPRVVPAATDAQRAALLGRMKQLAGDWEMASAPPDGSRVIRFEPTGGGSAVREIMFPGTKHEMTNVYHMDGPDLVMTHYCALGIQPRMRATGAAGNTIEFKSDGVSNLTSADAHYMSALTVEFVDADTIREKWRSTVGGRVSEERAVFELKRKRGG